MPSFYMRDWSAVRFMPSRAVARLPNLHRWVVRLVLCPLSFAVPANSVSLEEGREEGEPVAEEHEAKYNENHSSHN